MAIPIRSGRTILGWLTQTTGGLWRTTRSSRLYWTRAEAESAVRA